MRRATIGLQRPATKRPVKVWDLPVRIFHWSILGLMILSYVSVNQGWLWTHLVSGYLMMTALIFRAAWGLIGSDTARFVRFLKSPLEGLAHLRHLAAREPDRQIGHNAAGGWMVLIMLGLLAAMVGTGLFSNTFEDDDINGPFARLVSSKTSDWLTDLHATIFNVILAAVAVHVLTVLLYAFVKGQDLIRPMVTGTKILPGDIQAPRLASARRALAALAAAGGIVALVALT